ncbi:hypothetical protein EV146_108111 [Mesobacillus foraminis]|uniref:YwdI family protein n=2 Tax=Mesobacillus foraminis TaxID=279826 RepID=A0A4R2BC51_9BACI|nr:hypothetical protein EV146_108111 [Mesobacillus foraminis]
MTDRGISVLKCGEHMSISLQKLLAKMDAELKEAKSAGTESVLRERIHSLKTLCELVLDEPQKAEERRFSGSVNPGLQAPAPQVQPLQVPFQPQQPPAASMPVQTKRLEMEDDANGESLFDF